MTVGKQCCNGRFFFLSRVMEIQTSRVRLATFPTSFFGFPLEHPPSAFVRWWRMMNGSVAVRTQDDTLLNFFAKRIFSVSEGDHPSDSHPFCCLVYVVKVKAARSINATL